MLRSTEIHAHADLIVALKHSMRLFKGSCFFIDLKTALRFASFFHKRSNCLLMV